MKRLISLFSLSSFKFFLLLVVLVGTWLRLQKLDWGESYYFHPDEYHIGSAVDRLSFPKAMDPHFYAYGTFPLYLTYFTKLSLTKLVPSSATLSPVLLGRFLSALFSSLTLFVIFGLAYELFNKRWLALFSTLVAALTPGLIQQAHFATPESTLAFFLCFCLWLWLKWLRTRHSGWLYLSAVGLGLGIATKISALTYLPLFILIQISGFSLSSVRRFFFQVFTFLTSLALVLGVFSLVSPYSLLSYQAFRSTLVYEIGVGRGESLVFYTRQFINTIPLLFQYQNILPYALGPVVLLLGTLGFFLMVFDVFYRMFTRRPNALPLAVVLAAFLVFFLPAAFLFAKWTRFIAPSFPFFSIFSVYLVLRVSQQLTLQGERGTNFAGRIGLTFILLFLPTAFWGLMVSSIYFQPDVRVQATTWVNQNIAPRSFILTETGNTLEVPLWGDFQKKVFEFYYFDEQEMLQKQLPYLLSQADYFIVQSRRIFFNHQRLPARFPLTSRFYDLLFSGALGFEPLATFSAYPRLSLGNLILEVPDETAEETWSVFDHPVVRVYKKVKDLTESDYERLLKI